MSEMILTGKPSVDRPWLKYYPQQLLDNLQVPACTLTQYLQFNMPGLDVAAMHYYGTDVTWAKVFADTDRIAKALKAVGFGVGDQVPVFLRSVPEFFPLLLACEKIGASLLIRDNEFHENADAIRSSGAKYMFAHDFMSQEEMEVYLNTTNLEKLVLLDPCTSCNRDDMPEHIQLFYKSQYLHELAHSDAILSWNEFLALGDAYTGEVEAPVDIDRPLFRCYTSGSTGPSKQVVHSAHSIIGTLAQMNFYGASEVRPTWLVTLLPPCLVAVVVSMLLLPLASNKLLILDPFVSPDDLDLELMHYRPNCWPSIPFFCDVMVNSPRIPADFDMSFLASIGAGCEAINNAQLRRVQKFLADHNCKAVFTTGYGSSEAGSNVGFHISGHPMGNGNVGCPMPLSTVSIFKPGTTQELSYNEEGEICVCAPGNMIGYDTPEATAKALIVHEDGQTWLHMGDIGCMTEDGVLFTRGRGSNKRFTGGYLDLLPMENALADANIDGILDEFFVNIPDPDHEGYFLPFLYVVLDDGYSVDDVRKQVHAHLKPEWIPTEIHEIETRPFWHFKTHRIGLVNEVLAERVSA